MRTLAIILLCLCIPLSGLHVDSIPKYKRSYFGGWADSDDCQNTRHELLQKLSTAIMSFTDNTCRVLTGKWLIPTLAKHFGGQTKLILITWYRSIGPGNMGLMIGIEISVCALQMIQEIFLPYRNL